MANAEDKPEHQESKSFLENMILEDLKNIENNSEFIIEIITLIHRRAKQARQLLEVTDKALKETDLSMGTQDKKAQPENKQIQEDKIWETDEEILQGDSLPPYGDWYSMKKWAGYGFPEGYAAKAEPEKYARRQRIYQDYKNGLRPRRGTQEPLRLRSKHDSEANAIE